MVKLKNGERDPVGGLIHRAWPHFDPEPRSDIVGGAGVSSVIAHQVQFSGWVKIVGGAGEYLADNSVAGTGSRLSMVCQTLCSLYAGTHHRQRCGGASPTPTARSSVWVGRHHAGDPNFLGFNGSGQRAVAEIGQRLLRPRQPRATTLWLRESTTRTPQNTSNGFWVRVVNNGRAGMRFERVGEVSTAGRSTHREQRYAKLSTGSPEVGSTSATRQNALPATCSGEDHR